MKASSCSLDILPVPLLKNVFQCIGPCVLTIINASLVSGQIPAYFMNAVFHLLKKKEKKFDLSLLSSYKPISKSLFFAKILEKVVTKQLTAVLDRYSIMDKFTELILLKQHFLESQIIF